MKIEHIAIWAKDLELLKDFYCKYFDAKSNQKYSNDRKEYSSYFLTFESGCRLEIMKMNSIPESLNDPFKQASGIIHIAFSVGSEEKVNQITELLKSDGFTVADGPRHTGDGYYESVVMDPENNRIEITK